MPNKVVGSTSLDGMIGTGTELGESGTDSGESRGEGIGSVPFPIGNVYSRIGHRADASPVFSSVANKNFPSLGVT